MQLIPLTATRSNSPKSKICLQFSYNLCNLPKQITATDGTTIKYTYFADGIKFKAVDATGNGFAYTGSLRWSIENGVLIPESVAITGGRALYNDVDEPWSVNYYITDHLGSVRAVTDAEGEVLDTFDYMPYGSEFTTDTDNITDYRFTGKEKQPMFGNSNIYDSSARFQNTYGRFMSIDPKAESFYYISPYTYCAGDPVNLVDPDGEKPRIYIEGGFLGHAFISIGDGKDLIIYSYGRYGALDPVSSGCHSYGLTPSGEGVLRRLQGNDAATYLNSVMDDVQIFEIDIDSDETIASYYDALMQNKKAPDNASSMSGTSRVIDEYSLWDNNCVTTTVKGVNKCCNNILGDESYDIIHPGSLGNYLTELAEEHKYINKINKTKQYIKDLIESLND